MDHVEVETDHQGLSVRIIPANGPTKLVLSGKRAYARLKFARRLHGTRYDSLVKDSFYKLDEVIRLPFPVAGEELVRYLRSAGLQIRYVAVAGNSLAHEMRRMRARYSRTLPIPQEDGTVLWKHVPGTIDPTAKAEAAETLRRLGWDDADQLFPFAFDNACEMLTKRDVLAALFTGAGKTRLALAVADGFKVRGHLTSPVIVVAQKRHLRAWREELGGVHGKEPCGLLVARYGARCYEELTEKDDDPEFRQPYLLVSFERLTRMSEEQLGRLQEIARDAVIILDEAYTIANKSARRSAFLGKLQGAHHISLSATPFKGYVTSLLNVLQWTFRGGSVALPDYPTDRAGSARRFAAQFVTKARSADGDVKTIPFIRNLDQLQDLLAPLMVRRLRGEPEVCAVLNDVQLEEHHVEVDLNPEHRAMYIAVLGRFTEWYGREVAQRRITGRPAAIPQTEVMIKLGYLVRAISQPWAMQDHSDNGFSFPAYPRVATSLHEEAMRIARAQVDADNAVLIFGFMTDQLNLIAELLRTEGYRVGLLHGGVPQLQREREISLLQQGETQILLGSYGVAAEGLNLSAASVVVCTEWDWTPSVIKQAVGRIMRGVQEQLPVAYYLTARGTVSEYQRQLCMLKTDASSAALDHTRQTVSDSDVLDINVYCQSLVNVEGEVQTVGRTYALELE